jgi:maltose O-acetyltransferase
MQVLIGTSSHEVGPPEKRAGTLVKQGVTIEDGCWVGARAIVLPGVTIGRGCIIASGAVVTKDCEPGGLYAGVPARRLRDV